MEGRGGERRPKSSKELRVDKRSQESSPPLQVLRVRLTWVSTGALGRDSGLEASGRRKLRRSWRSAAQEELFRVVVLETLRQARLLLNTVKRIERVGALVKVVHHRGVN